MTALIVSTGAPAATSCSRTRAVFLMCLSESTSGCSMADSTSQRLCLQASTREVCTCHQPQETTTETVHVAAMHQDSRTHTGVHTTPNAARAVCLIDRVPSVSKPCQYNHGCTVLTADCSRDGSLPQVTLLGQHPVVFARPSPTLPLSRQYTRNTVTSSSTHATQYTSSTPLRQQLSAFTVLPWLAQKLSERLPTEPGMQSNTGCQAFAGVQHSWR